MATEAVKAEIERLRKELEYHNYRYYMLDAPEISDEKFDRRLRRLQELEEAHPQFADDLSPTQRVGGGLTKSFPTVKHQRPMLSLGNTYSREELDDFLGRIGRLLPETMTYVCELKYDGTAISIHYQGGSFQRAITRGDGTQGDDISNNVKTIPSGSLTFTGP